jgi:hypothetical protein
MSNNLKFISLSDNPDSTEVYSDDKLVIRDVKDLSRKEYYRQLVFKEFTNEVESEIKLFNISEVDSKSLTYTTVKTSKAVKQKKQKSCFDSNVIISHFVRIAISAMHFLDCSNWNDKPLEVLVVGGTVGLLPYFTKKVFKEYVNVTCLEENEKLKSLGEEYFGFNNSSDNVVWNNSSALKFVKSKLDHNTYTINKVKSEENNANVNTLSNDLAENKKKESKKASKHKVFLYDLIILNEMNFSQGQKVSPKPSYITTESLQNFKVRIL